MAKRKSAAGRLPIIRSKSVEKPEGADAVATDAQVVYYQEEPIAPQLEAKADLHVMRGTAATIVYVHGIGNKPTADILKCQWDTALFGFDLGERSRLAYWVNRGTYPVVWPGTCQSGDVTSVATRAQLALGIQALDVADEPEQIVNEIHRPLSAQQRRQLESLARQIQKRQLTDEQLVARLARVRGYRTKILPLPEWARKWFTRQLTRLLLQDVYEYFYDQQRRQEMRDSLISRLQTGGGPFVIIAHSQGSMIAYDVLCSPAARKLRIPLFLTIGSPLGMQEVQDQLRSLTGQAGGLAVPECVDRWINVSDPIDPVSIDQMLYDDFKPRRGVKVVDFIEHNRAGARDPHSATGYLQLDVVRQAVKRAVDVRLFQKVAPFTVARDLANEMEAGRADDRHPVLIELVEPRPGRERQAGLKQMRAKVVQWVQANVQKAEPALTDDVLNLELLEKYVSLRLTRSEVESLSADLGLDRQAIHHVYRNATKKALLEESLQLVQATTAHRGYDALGRNIAWAVLDTGIDPDHPHFQEHENIVNVFDCTIRGGPHDRAQSPGRDLGRDLSGHGTHVAGIIAGTYTATQPNRTIAAVAPMARLWIYKVLDDEGHGSDSFILKALDDIARKNRQAGSLVVHGVNLSLGGPFDVTSFGCGHTPLCKALRELWQQGVLVVIAAGNEGYLEIDTTEGEVGINADLSIGDPANLEEAIAVGSIHKSKPHHYGISYFSSRGPTADGRAKPDVVAPGERIRSARAGGKTTRSSKDQLKDLYVELSGTSMAAPHVSGVLAAFLSARTEFIGDPDAVKQRLLANCTDLGRDRRHQGAGMPNLVKMLLNS